MCTNVICVNETLCDETIDDSDFSLFGYNLMRCNRNRNGGGVALYIRDVFNFTRRDDLCVDRSFECIWVELYLPNGCPIPVCAIYNPDGKKLSAMLSNACLGDNEIVLLGNSNMFCKFQLHIMQIFFFKMAT